MKNFETEIPFFYSFNFIKILFYLIKLFKKKKLLLIRKLNLLWNKKKMSDDWQER